MRKYISAEDMSHALGLIYNPDITLPSGTYNELTSMESSYALINAKYINPLSISDSSARSSVWDTTWNDVLTKFISSDYRLEKLDPVFMASSILRYNGRYIQSSQKSLELDIYCYIRESVYRAFMHDTNTVHDVGAGSCFNAVAYAKFNSTAHINVYDWSPSSIEISKLLYEKCNINISGERFNFFAPSMSINSEDIVFTSCALEQLGDNYQAFLSMMLEKKPRRVVHIEPIIEKYDSKLEYDRVAAKYHTARGYLNGYYNDLIRLQNANAIRLVGDQRTGIGSHFHECYTILAWEPL